MNERLEGIGKSSLSLLNMSFSLGLNINISYNSSQLSPHSPATLIYHISIFAVSFSLNDFVLKLNLFFITMQKVVMILKNLNRACKSPLSELKSSLLNIEVNMILVAFSKSYPIKGDVIIELKLSFDGRYMLSQWLDQSQSEGHKRDI
jgi:hypothetical protein